MKPIFETIIISVFFIILVGSSYYLGTFNLIKFNIPISNSYKENSNCSNSILSKSAECLKGELIGFFNYNLSNIKEENFTIVKQSGGVCWQYSDWYKDNLVNFGFNSKTIDFYGLDTGHQITIAWTKNISNGEYCILDMQNIDCFKLGQLNMTLYNNLTQ